MTDILCKINFDEVNYFYKSPFALVDYSMMQSFSLIKSSVEVFAYYGIVSFRSSDIRDFFQELQLVQKKNGRVFVPSPKKVDSVLECCMSDSENTISYSDGYYNIESWNTDGYKYEIASAREQNRI
ncbi:MAG: hypothetical protein ACI4XP_04885 [Acutalibacteraceae bacterium]